MVTAAAVIMFVTAGVMLTVTVIVVGAAITTTIRYPHAADRSQTDTTLTTVAVVLSLWAATTIVLAVLDLRGRPGPRIATWAVNALPTLLCVLYAVLQVSSAVATAAGGESTDHGSAIVVRFMASMLVAFLFGLPILLLALPAANRYFRRTPVAVPIAPMPGPMAGPGPRQPVEPPTAPPTAT